MSLTFIFSVTSNSECVGLKTRLDLGGKSLCSVTADVNTHLGIVKMDHCSVILDHVDLLNARDVVD